MRHIIYKPSIDWWDADALIPLNPELIIGLALHHMAHLTWDFFEVHNYHKNTKGWNGIGYNFWIALDGTIYQGRGFHQGAGVKSHNHHLLNIGFQGDYDKMEDMPDAQFNAAIWLINYLQDKCPNARVVAGHKHWSPTACPGKHFPLAELLAKRYRNQPPEEVVTMKDLNDAKWAQEAVKELKYRKIINGEHEPNESVRWGELAAVANKLAERMDAIEERLRKGGVR